MKTRFLLQNGCVLLLIGLFGCVSQKYKSNVTRTETFDVALTYKQIAGLKFNKRSEPYVTSLKKEYAEKFNDAELVWKCVVFRERIANAIVESDSIRPLALDSLKSVPDETLKAWLRNLMKPAAEYKQPALSDTVKVHFEQIIFPSETEAVVIEGEHHHRNYYHLRKDEGLWKIYSDEDPEHKHDHD